MNILLEYKNGTYMNLSILTLLFKEVWNRYISEFICKIWNTRFQVTFHLVHLAQVATGHLNSTQIEMPLVWNQYKYVCMSSVTTKPNELHFQNFKGNLMPICKLVVGSRFDLPHHYTIPAASQLFEVNTLELFYG